MAETRHPRPWNWIILALIVLAAAACFAWVWRDPEAMRQDKVMTSIMIAMLGALALVLWLTLLSGLRWRVRGLGLAALAVLLGAMVASVRVQGVSGDLMPMLTWRWSEAPDRALAAPVAAPPAERPELPGLADYPQFLGPRRNGVLPGPALQTDWARHPPRLLWRQPIGAGWSAFAIAGSVAVTQEQRGDDELVTAYDAATGALLWSHADAARYDSPIAGIGPRATPTIDGDRVFTVGSTGILNSLDLDTGARSWRRDLHADAGSSSPDWGVSTSPLVVGSRLYVTSGGKRGRSGKALLAYDTGTGDLLWRAGTDDASYSSPAWATLGGVEQVVVLNDTTATGHDPATGTVLWEVPWPGRNPKVAQPVFLDGDRFLLSSGYGVGAALFALTPSADGDFSVERTWKNTRLKAKFTNILTRDAFAYGLDDGTLTCIEIATGRRRWKDGAYGHGQVILVDDVLLVQAESGEVALVPASPDQFTELSRFPALDGHTWNNAAMAGRYLFVRNDREAACYELPVDVGD